MTYAALPTRPARTTGLRAAAARLLRNLVLERKMRLAQRRLYELDDHILRDMGIRRGDIAAAVRGRAL